MPIKETELFYPETQQQWRDWLIENHVHKEAVWLIYYKKKHKKTDNFGVMLWMKPCVLVG